MGSSINVNVGIGFGGLPAIDKEQRNNMRFVKLEKDGKSLVYSTSLDKGTKVRTAQGQTPDGKPKPSTPAPVLRRDEPAAFRTRPVVPFFYLQNANTFEPSPKLQVMSGNGQVIETLELPTLSEFEPGAPYGYPYYPSLESGSQLLEPIPDFPNLATYTGQAPGYLLKVTTSNPNAQYNYYSNTIGTDYKWVYDGGAGVVTVDTHIYTTSVYREFLNGFGDNASTTYGWGNRLLTFRLPISSREALVVLLRDSGYASCLVKLVTHIYIARGAVTDSPYPDLRQKIKQEITVVPEFPATYQMDAVGAIASYENVRIIDIPQSLKEALVVGIPRPDNTLTFSNTLVHEDLTTGQTTASVVTAPLPFNKGTKKQSYLTDSGQFGIAQSSGYGFISGNSYNPYNNVAATPLQWMEVGDYEALKAIRAATTHEQLRAVENAGTTVGNLYADYSQILAVPADAIQGLPFASGTLRKWTGSQMSGTLYSFYNLGDTTTWAQYRPYAGLSVLPPNIQTTGWKRIFIHDFGQTEFCRQRVAAYGL